jgi:CubicO group peptidase (beta-lactamase class C family)
MQKSLYKPRDLSYINGMKFAIRFLWIFTLALALQASDVPSKTATGLDPQKLSAIRQRMQTFVDDGTIAGAVTLVARGGQVAALDAVGQADIAKHKPMKPDSMFWIASMTKPITATVIMILRDEGKLAVEDPVEKYLPEFKGQWLAASKSNDSLSLKRPARPVTLKDLLNHTSGVANGPNTGRDLSLSELVLLYSQQPLKYEPGSKWEYNNAAIDSLGRVVEVVSGDTFENFLQKRIFKPLGMKDTTFYPSGGQLKRVAKSYEPGTNGLQEVPIWFIKGPLDSRTRPAFPSGGLFSTASDMFKFYQMVLNGGTSDARRIVSAESIAMMTKTQTGDLKTGFTEGMSFGLGWAVVREPKGVTAMLSKGTYGHGGAYGTQGWVDPEKQMIFVLMIQRAKLPNADASPIRQAFQEAAVAAIVD